MKKHILAATLAVFLTTPVSTDAAQAFDWWGKAKEILNSDETQGTAESLGVESSLGDLTKSEMVAGLREALEVGTKRVVSQLGVEDGFNLDPKIHIPLPNQLQRVDQALKTIGMNTLTEELELRLNRAAELATPKAKELFINAITDMTITDAKNILTGPENAATEYLRKSMGPELLQEMQPIIDSTLAEAGAIQLYDQAMGQYGEIPFVPDVKANLKDYVSNKAMDGIFYYVAKEEAAIRNNPAERTTDLLKKVFSSVQN